MPIPAAARLACVLMLTTPPTAGSSPPTATSAHDGRGASSAASSQDRPDAEAAPPEAPVPLFDGRTLDGWHAIGGGTWTVRDGAIVGQASRDEPRHGLLVSDATFGDFTVTFEYRVTAGDSGFYFHVEESGDAVGVHGFQVEVDDIEPGGLYETGGRGWVVKPTPEAASAWHRKGDWNRVRLSAAGGDVMVHVNDHETARLQDDPGRRHGHLALQLHGGQDMHVEFRAIRLNAAPHGGGHGRVPHGFDQP